MSLREWTLLTRAASAVGLAVFAAVTVFSRPGSGLELFFNVWVYCGLMILACVIVWSRALLVADERPAWVAFGAALSVWTFGEIWYAAVSPETYPSIADLGFIGFYPLVYIGMVALVRARATAMGGTLWLDGVTASLAAGAVAAAVLFEIVLVTTEGSATTVVTNMAYPLGDVLLLSAVVGVFSLTGWRPGARWLLIGLGVVSTAIADTVYLFQSAAGTYVEGTFIDILWPAALLLIAAAAWAQDRTRAGLEVDGKPLLAVPAVCALASIAILVYDHFDPLSLVAVVLSAATLLAVIVRLGTTFRENRRLYELTRHEATTDALTGLGNRRKLLADLDRRLGERRPQPALLMIFDLDGFKGYNDTFGHPAGDALLARLGGKLALVPGSDGAAYRLGGDEFCLVTPIRDGGMELVIDRALDALREHGEGFDVGSSFGAVLLPEEAVSPALALHVADERLYAQKHSRRATSNATMEALLEALSMREPNLPLHLDSVGSLAVETGLRLGLDSAAARRARARRAAARPRQARRAGRDPAQGRPARRPRVGLRAPAHARRRADPARVAGPPRRRDDRPLDPRALGRRRLPGRPRRRGDPAGVADHRRLRRVHRDDLSAALPAGADRAGGTGRARAPRRRSVRPAGRGDARRDGANPARRGKPVLALPCPDPAP